MTTSEESSFVEKKRARGGEMEGKRGEKKGKKEAKKGGEKGMKREKEEGHGIQHNYYVHVKRFSFLHFFI